MMDRRIFPFRIFIDGLTIRMMEFYESVPKMQWYSFA